MYRLKRYEFGDERLVEQFDLIQRNFDLVAPVFGMVLNYPATADRVPPDLIVLDGRAVSRAENPGLFARWGVDFGQGDGRTTFNVPKIAAPDGLTAVTRAG